MKVLYRIPVKRRGEIVAWALVDLRDFGLRSRSWTLSPYGYATSNGESMHRAILGLAKGDPRVGHHRNEDPLDNRRENLQVFASNSAHLMAPHPKADESRWLRCIVSARRNARAAA